VTSPVVGVTTIAWRSSSTFSAWTSSASIPANAGSSLVAGASSIVYGWTPSAI
jgi:hypothetical protein